jgi:hypothetical protein
MTDDTVKWARRPLPRPDGEAHTVISGRRRVEYSARHRPMDRPVHEEDNDCETPHYRNSWHTPPIPNVLLDQGTFTIRENVSR